MLKNLLKSSVSAFVLLGALSSFDSSQAGNTHPGGNGRNDENGKPRAHRRRHQDQDVRTQEDVSPELQYILTPFGTSSNGSGNEEEATPEKNPTGKAKKKLIRESKKASTHNREDSHFSAFPDEITQLIMFHLNPEAALQAQLVCKKWHALIADGVQTGLEALENPSKEDEKRNPEFLRTLLFHPSTFVATHKKLASQYFEEVIRPSLGKAPESTEDSVSDDSQAAQSTGNAEHDKGYESDEFSENSDLQTTHITGDPAGDLYVPESIESFASLIRESRDHHRFLARMYANYDPSVDFREVFWASCVVKESPEMRDLLKQVIKTTQYKIEDSPHKAPDTISVGFMQQLYNLQMHQSLKQHLMALKILAMSGDEDAKKRMNTFNDIRMMDVGLFEGSPEHFLKTNNPDFLKHPLWGAYTVKDATDCDREHHFLNSLLQSKFSVTLNLEPIRAFVNYLFTLAPQQKSTYAQRLFSALKDVEYCQTGNESTRGLLESLEEAYEATDKRNLPNLVNIASDYVSAGHYYRALEILKDAHERAGNSPFRFKILWEMAECILASGDIAHLDQVEEYLQTIWEEVQRQNLPTPYLDISFSLTIGEGESAQTINKSDELDLYDVLVSKVAFYIYKGKFKDAERLLKDYNVTSETDLDEDNQGLMKAIQTQLPHMPKSLIKIFSEELRRFSINHLESPGMRKFLYENRDVFKRLLKRHPLDRRKFKKAMKDVPFAANEPQEGDTSKGKEKQKKKRNKKEKKKEKN
jgi:hypothetical protein